MRHPSPARRSSLLVAALLGAGAATVTLLGGCAVAATYPKVDGSVAVASPRLAPIPELMADAIEAAREDVEVLAADGMRLAFNLPEDTPVAVWNEVIRRVDGGAPALDSDVAVVHVVQVRVRPGMAEIDVVVEPAAGRSSELPYPMTVHMEQAFLRDWSLARTRQWRIPADVPALAWVEPGTEVADEAPALATPEPTLDPVTGPEDAVHETGEPVAPRLDGAGG